MMNKPTTAESSFSAGPEPSAGQRRELVARGHRLKARLVLGHHGVTDAFVAHVRTAFEQNELLKIRIEAKGTDDMRRLAADLADRLPCHLLQSVGRVILLYRKKPEKP